VLVVEEPVLVVEDSKEKYFRMFSFCEY